MATADEIHLRDVDHTGDLVKDPISGDLITSSGLENITKSILRRVSTEKGSLIHRPNYGCSLKQYQGAPLTMDTKRTIALAIQDQLTLDPRIVKLNNVKFSVEDTEPDKVLIIVNVTVKGYDENVAVPIPFGEVF